MLPSSLAPHPVIVIASCRWCRSCRCHPSLSLAPSLSLESFAPLLPAPFFTVVIPSVVGTVPHRWSLSHRCYPHRSSPLSSVRSFIVVIPSVVGTVPHRCHPELDSGSILAFGANSTVLGKGRCEILNQVQDDNDGGGVNDREG